MSNLVERLRSFGGDQPFANEIERLAFEAAAEITRLQKALETAREALEQLESAGAGMANMCFNLAQESYLPASVRQSMKTGQVRWDAAVRATRSLKDKEAANEHT